MPLALAQDAIALLIDLAERGEIDPWDVKVIDVIDRFLSELDPFEPRGQKLYEANLSQSGQAFLYASMLLLLKADNLTQAEVAEDAPLTDDELDLLDADDASGAPLPPNLERRLSRRAVAPPPKHRRVTLKELIEQLQTIAAALDSQTPRVRLKRPRSQSRSQAIRAIAQLAHQENLSEMAAALEQFFADHGEAATEDWLDFNILVELWVQSQSLPNPASADEAAAENPNHDRVGVFWALLLLSAQSKVELVQETFYQDLKVRRLPECPGSV